MLIAAAVAVLAIVTVVLSAMALTQFRSTSSPQASPVASPTATATATPSPTVTAAPSVAARVVPVPDRLIGAVDATRAYRVGVGACPEPRMGSAVSNDGGATWEAMDVAGITQSASALAFADLDGAFVSMATLAVEGCGPQLVRSYVAGTNWEVAAEGVGGVWYFDSRDPAVVHSPTGDRAAPCQTVAVAGRGEGAAVLCSDERVFASADSGETWATSATIPGAAAVARATDGYDVAVLNQAGCAGIQIVALTIDLQPQTTGACLAHAIPEGTVALSTGADGELWIWAADRVARSGDRGATWR